MKLYQSALKRISIGHILVSHTTCRTSWGHECSYKILNSSVPKKRLKKIFWKWKLMIQWYVHIIMITWIRSCCKNCLYGFSLPDIPNFISPRKSQVSVNHERSSFRKIVSSYGSVPPYNNSSYTSKNSYPSPQVSGGTYIGATGSNSSKSVAQELENP